MLVEVRPCHLPCLVVRGELADRSDHGVAWARGREGVASGTELVRELAAAVVVALAMCSVLCEGRPSHSTNRHRLRNSHLTESDRSLGIGNSRRGT